MEQVPFERILVYASLEDEAFLAVDQAATLARASGASLTLVSVLEDEARWTPLKTRSEASEGMRAFLEASQRQVLEARAGALREDGLKVEVDVRWGTPWLELIGQVLAGGYDLVVKTAEGAARGRGLFFGSTALHLVRKCPCPVWVVSSASNTPPARVLAAIDPTEDETEDRTRSALARRILGLAETMAGKGAELHVASAWRAPGETLLRRRVPSDELEAHVREAKETARERLERILAAAGDPLPEARVHPLWGEARDALPEFVEREGFDLLVMGSLGRTGIAGLLIGDTAETLIRSVRCSVLVVKPPGFVCPVEPPAA